MQTKPGSSTAEKPDLDWSQVRETINMLTLAVSQIECTMTDGEKSVSELSQSFTFIASELQGFIEQQNKDEAIGKSAGKNSGKTTVSHDKKEFESQTGAKDIHAQVVSAIVSFQFYDRLSQRLHHVKRDLSELSELVSNPNELYNPNAWKKLQSDIMSNYTMEEERIMFQHIMNGATVEEALEVYHHHFEVNQDNDDESGDQVDLF